MVRVRGGNEYHYYCIRDGNNIRQLYAGTGTLGEIVLGRVGRIIEEERAAEEEARRAERERIAAVRLADRKREARVVAELDGLGAVVDGALMATGLHRVKRGPWRRRRRTAMASEIATKGLDRRAVLPPDATARRDRILKGLRSGDEAATAAAQEEFAIAFKEARGGNSTSAAVYVGVAATDPKLFATLGGIFDSRFEEAILGDEYDPIGKALARSRAAALRAELAGPDPSPIETLLAQRIAIAWLESESMTRRRLQSRRASPAEQERIDRWADRAERRLLYAVTALDRIRKVQVTAIQVIAAVRGGPASNPPSPELNV
jgi:hypothetical protein